MDASPELLKIAMQAQVSLIIISAIAMAIGIVTAQKTPRIPRNTYILWLCLACILILPTFFILKPLVFPGLDLSDPNPGEAALLEIVRLMGFAFVPTAILMGRYTVYRNRDAGNADRIAYLAAIPIFGSIWILRLLIKPTKRLSG
ncbi:hypothetical protein OAN80_01675 [Alphaproteobacteria bacterium]|nr:hypothetical protein [Alphaproteobacteria bacterium]